MGKPDFIKKIFDINQGLKKWSRIDWLFYYFLIPFFLSLIFFLPDSLKDNLILKSFNPNIISVFFNHYTHINFNDLVNNLVIYLIIIFLLFNIELKKRRFYIVTTSFIMFLPIILSNMLLILVPTNFLMIGFSGINAGFIGYLIFSSYNFLKNRHEFIKLSFLSLLISSNFVLICIINNFNIIITGVICFITLSLIINNFDTISNLINEFKRVNINRTKKSFFGLFYQIFLIFFIGLMNFSLAFLMPSYANGNYIINSVGHYFGWMFGFIIPMFF